MVRLGLITCVLVAVGSTASATPVKRPPCSVAKPDAFIPLAIATPVVAALRARHWIPRSREGGAT